MSAVAKKPPAGGTATPSRRPPSADPTLSAAAPARGPSRSPTQPSPATAATTNGVTRTRSLRGGSPLVARAALQRAGAGVSSLSNTSVPSEAEEEARAETIAVLDDLKERLRKSETLADQFQKQAQVLQIRLDEATQDQGKLEEKVHESEEKIEVLEHEKRDALKRKREMESIYEAERSSMTKEREESAEREEEMQAVIHRLKDSLNQKSTDEEGRLSRRCKYSSYIPSVHLTHNSKQTTPLQHCKINSRHQLV